MRIFKEFTFEAAHMLPKVREGHKCGRLHGHSYRVEVHVEGDMGSSGMVMDFAEIKYLVQPVIDQLDHYYLNEIPGLSNPTSESLAYYLWYRIIHRLPSLCEIVVRETCTSGASYRGE